ncbi:MAG: ABC transporter permease [Anaerofustis stercorihominis]|nr:ABC transporter permease [Anaerofustis stercorihominis]
METVKEIGRNILKQKVVLMFVALTAFGILMADTSLAFIISEVVGRFSRNSFLVLALIIPVLAGLGLNFGITVGAMAIQIGVFISVYNGFTGVTALLVAIAIGIPLAILFGWLLGKLYNKTKGVEMITGLVVAYLADGFYQLLFLFIFGGVIKMDESTGLIIPGGVGVKNTIDLDGSLKGVIDNMNFVNVAAVLLVIFIIVGIVGIVIKRKNGMDSKSDVQKFVLKVVVFAALVAFGKTPFFAETFGTDKILFINAVRVASICMLAMALIKFVSEKVFDKDEEFNMAGFAIKNVGGPVALYALTLLKPIQDMFFLSKIPMASYICIGGIIMFNKWILSTKLGQDMRTVGQSRSVANSSGINVDKVRVIATIFSTVLAAFGQLIYLQSLGTLATYNQHTSVGQYSVAALLAGGASIVAANNGHGIVGVLIFHALFVVAPLAADTLLGNALLGEYFRVFVCYGVIALALAMHAWKKSPKKDKKAKEEAEAKPEA